MYLFFLIPFSCFSQDWNTDFNTAKSIANEKNQNIVLVFSGSDWCAPCMKLEREIFGTEVFKNYSKDNYTLLKADFPKRKKNALSKELQLHNNNLAELFNPNGYFPLVVVLDKSGKLLGQLGYKKTTPEGYIKLIDEL